MKTKEFAALEKDWKKQCTYEKHTALKTSFDDFIKAVEKGVKVSDGSKTLYDSHTMGQVNKMIEMAQSVMDGNI